MYSSKYVGGRGKARCRIVVIFLFMGDFDYYCMPYRTIDFLIRIIQIELYIT